MEAPGGSQDLFHREEVVDRGGLPGPGGSHVLGGQRPRRGGGLRRGPAAAHLLCPAGAEAGLHQL